MKKGLFVQLAERILAKNSERDAEKKKIEDNKLVIRRAQFAQLENYADKFLLEQKELFVKNVKPEFKTDEKVLTNYFGCGDQWEGTAKSLQSHTPYVGPITVKVKTVVVDTSFLTQCLHDANANFDNMVMTYEEFTEKITKIMKNWPYPAISWAYKIKVPGDNHLYWKYTWRESKFLKLDSEAAKLSIGAWKKFEQKTKALKAYEELNRQYTVRLEDVNDILETIKK